MTEKSEEDWIHIEQEFYQRTNFPHCIGAVDGKHIRLRKPVGSGSSFFNYKSYFSIVLMALVDADYNVISIDVGANGASSDSNVFKRTNLYKKLERNGLNIPQPKTLPNDESGKLILYVIVGDEAFALSEHVLRTYSFRNLNISKRIFNYRLTRARRIVKCAFRILSNKFRIFHRPIDVSPNFCDTLVKACCILHNFIRRRDGVQYEDILHECSLETNVAAIGVRSTAKGTDVREYFIKYFPFPAGSIPWQYDKV